jgi:hypothetical protein
MRSLRPVPYGSLLASNLRAARAAANLSQSDVGERMRLLGFTAWLRSTVSLAEQDKRRVVKGTGEVQWTGNTPKYMREPGTGSWMAGNPDEEDG